MRMAMIISIATATTTDTKAKAQVEAGHHCENSQRKQTEGERGQTFDFKGMF